MVLVGSDLLQPGTSLQLSVILDELQEELDLLGLLLDREDGRCALESKVLVPVLGSENLQVVSVETGLLGESADLRV